MTVFRSITIESIDICWLPKLDGGGHIFGQDYIPFLKAHHFGKVKRIFEWCSGPAFIGFALLGHGFCDSLCLADINPLAVEVCQETIRKNRLQGKVDVYLSDCLESIPTYEAWDLVVGNPPHSGTGTWDIGPEWGLPLLWSDKGWDIHQRFYLNVAKFLNPGATVLIQENNKLSSVDTFKNMIEKGGLEMNAWTYHSNIHSWLYYIRSWK
jgi:methylase of polypeptide subunit release factors